MSGQPHAAPQVKAVAAAALLCISLKYVIYEKCFGSFIAPAIPGRLMIGMEMLYGTMVILCFLLFIKDCTALILWVSRCLGTTWVLPFSHIARSTGILILSLGLGSWSAWQAVRVPDIRTVEIHLPRMDRHLDGFSIVQLSDLHIGSLLNKAWLEKVVEKTNSLAPDLIAVTGDMIDSYPENLKGDVAALGLLSSKYGVFGVAGNHEYYFREKEWRIVFESMGITMLNNGHRVVTDQSGAKIVVAGVPDPAASRFSGEGPDAAKAMQGAPANATRILLSHRPNVESGKARADIQLSGHTHGGMFFFLKILLAHFNGGLVCGLYNLDGTQLYVSPGTGLWAGFSCRLGVPSEITRIVLRKRQAIAD
ncbi:metallophosphoesterase [Desulfobacter vibrioformis]|uniref:metallophosphoesterase n=1 Tax=Desulfobacter vibrioformis TaxID=34031 RepID=UPI00068C544E|nr:metallophosphoesterase [Desulfobacter vibrioformis]